MSRPRVIDQDKILDAAEAVVAREGAARLTLDAVATEAGISKARVIYDYKSKQALIKAVIERKVAREDEKVRAAIARLGPGANARIRGIIAAVATPPDDKQAVALQLCSALAQDLDLRCTLQDSLKAEMAAVKEDADDPQRAMLAFLAVEGLRLLELLGLLAWSEPERLDMLRAIERLVANDGAAAGRIS